MEDSFINSFLFFRYKSENLGEILRGDRVVNTAYEVQMGMDIQCRQLCTELRWDARESSEVFNKIDQEYFVHLLIDNLPCATQFQMPDTKEMQYEPGFRYNKQYEEEQMHGERSQLGIFVSRLGFEKDGRAAINNHLKLILSYHVYDDTAGKEVYRVVGFRVETASVDKESYEIGEGSTCSVKDGHQPQFVAKDAETSVYFTYSVHWEKSPIRWASRWDIYLNMADVQIHWFSIINSVVVVFFLSGIITMVREYSEARL